MPIAFKAMRRCLAIVVVALLGPAASASADFYTPPQKLPGRTHGDVIRAKVLHGPAAISGGGRDELVLYRSVGVNGKPDAVSGIVSVPRGKAPRGGWPVITYDHGTTGIADSCAPSRDSADSAYAYPLLRRWLKAGWAVVRTDYEGLGTPGVHPYLIGTSEGRATLDIVRAARRLRHSPLNAHKVVIAGHSQGGHAALFAASLAPRWTPELRVRGTIAFAPASHLAVQAKIIPTVALKGLSGIIALIVRGIATQNPALHVQGDLTPRAEALYPQTLTRCLPALDKPDSFGALATNEIFRTDSNLAPLIGQLGTNDPENLQITTPVLVEQGTADQTVLPLFTDELVKQYLAKKISVNYVKYVGFTHTDVVTKRAAQIDATAYIRARFKH